MSATEMDPSLAGAQAMPQPNGEPGEPLTYLIVDVSITSPSSGALLGSSVTVSGTASCKLMVDRGEDRPPAEYEGIHLVDQVAVQFGTGTSYVQATPQGPSGNWSQWSVTRSKGTGSLTLTARIRATDTDGITYQRTHSVTVQVDATAPALAITTPPDGSTFTWVEGGTPVTIGGTASDTQSGVSVVEWSLNNSGQFSPATPQSPGNWASWTVPLTLPSPGAHAIAVRARDGMGNLTLHQITLNVALIFQPRDTEDVVSMSAYLDDLLIFASQRARRSATGPALDRSLLSSTFFQPFDELTDPVHREIANQPVPQVRLGIEVFRRYLDDRGIAIPPDAHASYLRAAYHLMLRHLGTSYEELRLARVADADARSTLARRLGIGLGPTRPDHLDSLVISPGGVSEADLQALFGLIDTARDPLAGGVVPQPLLLTWRLMYLRSIWQNQDADAPSGLDNLGLIVDPDIVRESDLRDAIPGNPAYDLLQARIQWVEDSLSQLAAMRQGQPSDLEGFDAIAESVVGPISELLSLAQQHQQGEDIRPLLVPKQLALKPFLQLVRVRELAASAQSPTETVVLDSEWEDVYSILTQVKKVQQAGAWRDEELAQNLILGPDAFTLPGLGNQAVDLPRWRANQQARRGWLDRLEGRINQEKSVVEALRAAVEATEELTLPGFRDDLVKAAAVDPDPAVAADQLTKELVIDFKSSGNQRTTRVNQAIASLQTVLFSLRTRRFIAPHPATSWVPDLNSAYTESDFDREWQWIGAYGTWRSAMLVFGYPEGYLLPNLREYHLPNQTPSQSYGQLVGRLRNLPRITPAQARMQAAQYLQDLRAEMGTSLPAALRSSSFVITDQLSDAQLAERRMFVQVQFSGVTDPHLAPNYLKEIFYFVPMLLALQLQRSSQYTASLDWFQTVYSYNAGPSERKIYHGLVLEENIDTVFQRTINWLLDGLNPHDIAVHRANAYTRFTIVSLVQCFLEFASAEFTRDTYESIPRARALYMTALDLLNLPEMEPVQDSESPFPPNPVLLGLRMHAELNLFKLRNGLNIAGMKRQTAFDVSSSEPIGSLPAIGTTGHLTIPRSITFRPTPYRYSTLIERTQHLITIAQQVEASYLSAIQMYDSEAYNLLKARQDIEMAHASVQLQDLRVAEAEGGVRLADLQRARAQITEEHFDDLITQGRSLYESASLAMLGLSLRAADSISVGLTGPSVSVSPSGKLQTMANVLSTIGSYERREQEWQFQRELARQDILIGAQQIALAQDHVRVVGQERVIAGIQVSNAEETLEFLANKFTNFEFYDWMRATLGTIYRYFLQQATAMAQLAQHQLAFERQEVPPNYIQSDYWEVPPETGSSPGGGDGPDRQGLTGSARLLQDVVKLDQHAFATNRRKLQLSQTLSLAQLFPAEFQQFRETGVLRFTIPMEMFDRAFPGHYLRLIRRVRTSVIALIPPTQGIRAVLTASGISRVAIGQDSIQTIVARRDPELVAFTTPIDATGTFELQPEGDMLLPFEGMGVDTAWELSMPRASNIFDYNTIADVLMTVEYTALNSENYRAQVIQQLDRNVSADRPFSFRHQFADQWYDLHNPDQTSMPMVVQVRTRREDFPSNIEGLKVQHVLLYFARVDGATFEVPVSHLRFTVEGGASPVGGGAVTVDGTISTRRSNGTEWIPITGDNSPFGTWELAFPDTVEVRNYFRNEQIEDILMVITYRGQTPPWPRY